MKTRITFRLNRTSSRGHSPTSLWMQRAFGAISSAFMSVCLAGAADPADAAPPAPPGKLVDIGGYKLHIWCMGKEGESPAVVLIPGAGDGSMHWSLVQPEVAKFTQTVSFDRAGFAWSDPGPTPRTMRQEAYELHQILAKSEIKPPYVLV